MASSAFVPVDGAATSGAPEEVPGPVAEPSRAPRRVWRRAAPLAAVGALAAVAAVAWRRRCIPSFAGDSVVSLAELPDDGLELDARRGDEDALREWLSTASASREAADAGADRESIEKAMSTKDPREAERLVKRAMSRALSKSREQRQHLKRVVDSRRHSLKGSRKAPFNLKSQQEVYTAQCVFNSLQAVDDIAMAAANLNDKVKTMTDLPNKTLVLAHMSKQAAETKAIVGEVNDFYFMDNLAMLATHISLAANDCATTLTKNVDALCSASVFSLFGSLAQAAGGGSMIGLACRGVGQEVEAGAHPSNLGTGLVGHALPGIVPYGLDRRLQGEVEQETGADHQEPQQPAAAAPPRKLLFGGGFGSDATLCGVHVMEVMWNLAQAALWITQAAEGNLGRLGKCSNHDGVGDLSETVCAVDVTGILFAYAEIARYLQLAIVNCADTLNLGAMCGAGVSGVVGSLAQMGHAGAGLHYACEEMQDTRVKAAIDVASGIEGAAQHHFGRRLEGGEGGEERYPSVEALKARFSSSEDLWKSMGYDMQDKAAPFRQRQQHREKDVVPPASMAELVREDAEPAAGSGLLGGVATCPSA